MLQLGDTFSCRLEVATQIKLTKNIYKRGEYDIAAITTVIATMILSLSWKLSIIVPIYLM